MFKPSHPNQAPREKDILPVKAFVFNPASLIPAPHILDESVVAQSLETELCSSDNRKIYLSGVPKCVDEIALRRHFEELLGEVEDVNIIEQNTIGPFRYGFVTLKSQEDVEYCMQLEFITIRG